jgi:hypothetical protein
VHVDSSSAISAAGQPQLPQLAGRLDTLDRRARRPPPGRRRAIAQASQTLVAKAPHPNNLVRNYS